MNARDDAQNRPDWVMSWPLKVATLDGREATVTVGVTRTGKGRRVALQIDDETTLILPLPHAPQLIANLRMAVNERLRMHNRGEDR
jgi:hypothetical protein